jgi:hypothetical protein
MSSRSSIDKGRSSIDKGRRRGSRSSRSSTSTTSTTNSRSVAVVFSVVLLVAVQLTTRGGMRVALYTCIANKLTTLFSFPTAFELRRLVPTSRPKIAGVAICTLYTVQYALCTRYTLHYALCTIHFTSCIMDYGICTIQYALYNIHYTL